MINHSFLRILLFLLLSISLSSCGGGSSVVGNGGGDHPLPVNKSKPNIVIILTDDMRWDLMSLLNHPFLKTPNMDRLASEGVLFEKAFIPIPVCSPSRAGLLTGRDPHRASAPRILWRNNSFIENQITFPKLLHDHGYKTGYFGKWHLGNGKVPKPGYDQWESFDWLGDFTNTTLWINGEKKQFQGFADDIISNRAANFIKQNSGTETPFFALIGLKQPHFPFASPARYKDKFKGVHIPPPETFDEDFSVTGKIFSPFLSFKEGPLGRKFFGNFDNYIKKHYRAILGLDDSVGRIMKALEESGELDNTLFIYTSDNGYSLGDHGLTEKHVTYEEPIRIPMLVRYPPAIQSGTIRSEMVSNIDIAPTVLDFAGIDIPDDMTGLSWKPLFKNPDTPVQWRKNLFFWFENLQAAVRTDRYKLIKSLSVKDHYELYDLVNDPKEINNLYNQTDFQALQHTMLQLFDQEAKKIGWTQRKSAPIKNIYTSQVMPKAQAVQRLKQLSLLSADTPIPDSLEGKIQWEKQNANKSLFKLNNNNNTSAVNPSILITIPMERLTDWDPFVVLSFKGQQIKGLLFSKGKQIWDSHEQGTFLNYANPPLHNKRDYAYILLEFPASQEIKVRIIMEAPDQSIKLLLEE